jgi:hypothetical protein
MPQVLETLERPPECPFNELNTIPPAKHPIFQEEGTLIGFETIVVDGSIRTVL